MQGSAAALPWVKKAGGTYRALLDQHNVIGRSYGLKYVPIGIVLDKDGALARAVGSINIDEEGCLEQLTEWVVEDKIPDEWVATDRRDSPPPLTVDEQEADVRFQLAIVLLERGNKDEAVNELKRAFRLDPLNWLIRKQMWALETPEAFYSGDVDYAWQKEQMAREQA